MRIAKEVSRDLIAKAGLGRLHLSVRKLRGQNVDHLYRQTLAERFSAIYENKVWLNGRSSGSLSGLGSDLASTNDVRGRLSDLLASLDTRSLLDVGCGDFTWMKEVSFPFTYLGTDIVPEVIAANNAHYASDRRSFQVLDATSDPLPSAGAILCREVLFHLSFSDIGRLLRNVRRSYATFFIATNDNSLEYNADIRSGDFRLLNLHRTPFHLPAPHQSIPDTGVAEFRTLSVWRLSDLPDPS